METILGNECILSPQVDRVKQNGHTASSPRKADPSVVAGSPENGPAQHRIPNLSPDAGGRVLEEAASPDVKLQCKSKYITCPTSGSLKNSYYRTPPSRTKSSIVVGPTNPFEVNVADRLLHPIYSPSIFARVVSPSHESPTSFRWTIEEISRINPADIDEFPIHQYTENVDPEVERSTQEAINKFFLKSSPLLPSPSPWKCEASAALRLEMNANTPSSPLIPINASPGFLSTHHGEPDSELDHNLSSQKASMREVWTQTTLTLPPVLPPSMELALKPFFTFTQDQQHAQQTHERDESGSGNVSLRRKLFTNHESSPSPGLSTSSQHHFPFGHGASSQSIVQFQGRTFGTPVPGSNVLPSPAGISPVQSGTTPMRRVKSATRLDFNRDQEDMSLDVSMQNPPGTPRQTLSNAQVGACSPLGTAPLHEKDGPESHGEHPQSGGKWATKRNKRNSLNCSSDAMSISQTSTPVKANVSLDASSAHNMMDISQNKPSSQAEGWREGETLPDVTYQHDVTSFSYSQQGVSSNMMSQDTGYGTRSSCDPVTFQSGTNSMFGLSLTRDKMGYEDSLATWPINPNVVSSTPTKTLGARISEYQRDAA